MATDSARRDTVLRYYEEHSVQGAVKARRFDGYSDIPDRDASRDAVRSKRWFRGRSRGIGATRNERVAPKIEFHPLPSLGSLTAAEIRVICLIMLVLTAVAVGMILMAAEAAVTQQEINELNQEILQTDKDIVNIKVDIEQAQSIDSILSRAVNDLGMKEPEYDQYIYISDLPEPEADFARYIKERAYDTEQTAQPSEGQTDPSSQSAESTESAEPTE
jgi:cell division protein FtsL